MGLSGSQNLCKVFDERDGINFIYTASSPVIRLNSPSVCFHTFSTTPSFLSLARSSFTLGPALSPYWSTEYTPLPFVPPVPLATATPSAKGTPEAASPFLPAGYLALVARNK